MTAWRFITRSLIHHWRINSAVALGVMAATAVLTGALLVGDSVRGSLRALTLERLGRIQYVLVTDRFFRAELAEEIARMEGFDQHFERAVPAILFPAASVEHVDPERPELASNVTVIAATEDFWQLGEGGPTPRVLPSSNQVVLNEPLASELGVEIGELVTLRLPSADDVPADSPLGDRRERVQGLPRLEVVDIVAAEGLGRFSMRPHQGVPRNVYLPVEAIQQTLGQFDRINAVLIGGYGIDPLPEAAAREAEQLLAGALRPIFDDAEQVSGLRLEDYGLTLDRVQQTFEPEDEDPQVVYDYYSLTTSRMLFAQPAAEALEEALGPLGGQPLLTYLATSIQKLEEGRPVGQSIPYSTVTAVDSSPAFDLLAASDASDEPLADDELILNQWAAENLNLDVGDAVRLSYFEPETVHGETVERSADFRVRAVVPLTEPLHPYDRRRVAEFDQPPTIANDPDLTPVVQGFTDQRTIREADPPFPFDRDRIRPEDDDYWEFHRTTPKAFVSLERGRQLWGSRFGSVTSLRIPAEQDVSEEADVSQEAIERLAVEALAGVQEALEFRFIPVKQSQLEAAAGTTPFDVLFFLLSFFVIVSALMLVALLFRLGMEKRAAELGTLLAVGMTRQKTTRWWVIEGFLVSAVGGVFGVLLGIGYAWLMVVGLTTVWVGAIATPFLEFYFTPRSLAVGWLLGVLVCAATIWWSVRRARRVSARRLLSGRFDERLAVRHGMRRWARWTAMGLLLVAVGLAGVAVRLGGEVQAGVFVGAGALLLIALLLWTWERLRHGGEAESAAGRFHLARLAGSSAERNPSRSTLTIGLIAAASFLIVAMSAFRIDPSPAGSGGFPYYAQSARPIYVNLNDPAERRQWLGAQADLLQDATILPLRFKPGDDASCTNLYQTTQPQVLGVTPEMVAYYDRPDVLSFPWADSAAETDQERENPWRLLDREFENGAIPVVLDRNTAMYSFQMYGGVGEEKTFHYDDGTRLHIRVVGFLSNSIFQGGLLTSERHLLRTFPAVSGYSYFLIDVPDAEPAGAAAGEESDGVAGSEAIRALEVAFRDEGFDVRSAHRLLEELLAVQNTYLSTFQALGALGLLLGTFGLATVQLRSVLERRGELALLRAAGFRQRRLAGLVMLENVMLLVGGLAVGVMAALLAVLPHMVFGTATMPGYTLFVMLGIVLLVGIVSGLMAVYAMLQAPLIAALRGE